MNLSTARRNSIRAALTSSGMRPARRAEIKPACGYYMGASSSPSFVLVLAVTDEVVRYCDSYSLAVQTQQRWIFEDLVSRARETLARDVENNRIAAESADVSTATGRLTKRIAEVCAERLASHGARVCFPDYDRMEVRIRAAKGEDVYSIGQQYGVTGDWDSAANEVDVTCSRENFDRIRGAGLDVVSERTVKACPLA